MPETVLHGRYTLGVVLGAGGFGCTYMGWDTGLDKAVAIKEYAPVGLCSRDTEGHLIPVEETAFLQGKSDFWGEAQTVYARFDVPGICPVLECFEEGGTVYMVEEYMPGGTLRELLDKHPGRRLPYGEAVALFAPVLEGLAMLHGEGIVHLDISPDNLMLDGDGKLRLIDFGSAAGKHAGGKPTAKYSYASPEQLGAGGKIGPWSDLYALCAVLYETLSGERPAPALQRMQRDTLSPVSRRVQLPEEGEAAIMQGLGLDVQSRFFALSPFMEKLGLPGGGKALLEVHRRQWGDRWLEAVSAPALLKKRSRRGLTGLQKRRIALLAGAAAVVLALFAGGCMLYERTHPEEVLQWRLEQSYKQPKPQRPVIIEGTELYAEVMDSLQGYERSDYGVYTVDRDWVEKMVLPSNNTPCFPMKEALGRRALEVTLGMDMDEENLWTTFTGLVSEGTAGFSYLVVGTSYSVRMDLDSGQISWNRDAVTGYMQNLRLETTDRALAMKFLLDTFPCFIPETYFTEEEAEGVLDAIYQGESGYSLSAHSRFYLYGWYSQTGGWYISITPQDGLQTGYGY